MGIPLPAIDSTFMLESVTVDIPIFEKDGDITEQSCTLPYRPGENRNYKYTTNDTSYIQSKDDSCVELYEQQLCPSVRNVRNKNYTNRFDKLYGPYDDTAIGIFKKKNAFRDCNCENSFYKHLSATELSSLKVMGSQPQVSTDTMAQTLDIRCNLLPLEAWKKTDSRMKNLCVNSISTGNISAKDQANLSLNQSCSTNSKEPSATVNASSPKTPPANMNQSAPPGTTATGPPIVPNTPTVVTTPSPVVTTPSPVVTTPTPPVTTPTPPVTTPTPVVTTPTVVTTPVVTTPVTTTPTTTPVTTTTTPVVPLNDISQLNMNSILDLLIANKVYVGGVILLIIFVIVMLNRKTQPVTQDIM